MKTLKYFLFGTAVLALTHCGGDSNSGTPEAQAEASAVANAVTTSLGQLGLTGGFARINPRAQSSSTTITDVVVDCTGGGTATVSGTVSFDFTSSSETSAELTLGYDVTEVFDGCKSTANNDSEYTIDGSLAVNGDGTMSLSGSDTSASFELNSSATDTGTISVTGDDVSVTDCEVDLTTGAEVSGNVTQSSSSYSGKSTWDGSVCGVETSGSVSYSS